MDDVAQLEVTNTENREDIIKKSILKKKMLYLGFKRLIDIVFALIGCICLLPITLIVKITYLLNGDRHSIFYTQTRVGKNGKLIHLYKFRSMVPNADEVLKQMLKKKKYKDEWKKYQKFENDPRITKIGGILRKTSLDEVPQFINVLKGDMSLIGPRPLIVGELDEHGGDHGLYESIRPGITGWWACNGRSATTYEERLALEYYYINNLNFRMDIKCVFKTIVAVIKKDGAK